MKFVLEVALAKNPNIRTKSVGELATAVGRAYGLQGDHLAWARMPQAELAKLIAQGMAGAGAVARPLETAADPFAAPPQARLGAQPMAPLGPPLGSPAPGQTASVPQRPQVQPGSTHQRPAIHQPPIQEPAPPTYPGGRHNEPVGIPGLDNSRPQWLIPVAVGLVALVVGGGIAIVLAR